MLTQSHDYSDLVGILFQSRMAGHYAYIHTYIHTYILVRYSIHTHIHTYCVQYTAFIHSYMYLHILSIQFIEEMINRYGNRAREAGVYIVPSCGFDSIPNDLGALVLRKAFNGEHNQ